MVDVTVSKHFCLLCQPCHCYSSSVPPACTEWRWMGCRQGLLEWASCCIYPCFFAGVALHDFCFLRVIPVAVTMSNSDNDEGQETHTPNKPSFPAAHPPSKRPSKEASVTCLCHLSMAEHLHVSLFLLADSSLKLKALKSDQPWSQ